MSQMERFVRFNAVGALGIGVQLATIWLLTTLAGLSYVPATIIAVSVAIAHNFLWHLRWTWADREVDARAAQAFISFVAANGVVSYAGNVLAMIILVDGAGLPVVPANLMAIAACGLVNFWLGDTFVFESGQAASATRAGARSADRRVRRAAPESLPPAHRPARAR